MIDEFYYKTSCQILHADLHHQRKFSSHLDQGNNRKIEYNYKMKHQDMPKMICVTRISMNWPNGTHNSQHIVWPNREANIKKQRYKIILNDCGS